MSLKSKCMTNSPSFQFIMKLSILCGMPLEEGHNDLMIILSRLILNGISHCKIILGNFRTGAYT